MKKTIILLLVWIVIGLIGSNALQNHNYIVFFVCALVHPILSIFLFLRIFGAIVGGIHSLFTSKKKFRIVDEKTFDDEEVEQITLDHPDYIGILTKINKKKPDGK